MRKLEVLYIDNHGIILTDPNASSDFEAWFYSEAWIKNRTGCWECTSSYGGKPYYKEKEVDYYYEKNKGSLSHSCNTKSIESI